LKNFIKGRWFPLTVAILIIAAMVLVMAFFGWRITYASELENSWEAISGVAAWVGAIASFGAIMVAIWIPKRIADQQNKIALFEKRFRIYKLLISCGTFVSALKLAENVQDAWTVFMLVFYEKDYGEGAVGLDEFENASYVSSRYLAIVNELSQCEFLFSQEISAGVLCVVNKMVPCLNDWFKQKDQRKFEESKRQFLALSDTIEELTDQMKSYLDLSK